MDRTYQPFARPRVRTLRVAVARSVVAILTLILGSAFALAQGNVAKVHVANGNFAWSHLVATGFTEQTEPPLDAKRQENIPSLVQAGVQQDPPTREKVQQLLRQLQSASYQDRQRAFLELWQCQGDLQPLLEELGNDPDPQCATSAKWLMLMRRLGCEPADIGDGLTNLGLVRIGKFQTLRRLAEDHRWNQILVILELLDEEQRNNLIENEEPETLLAMALRDQQDSLLPVLVDRLYTPVAARAARQLWRTIGFPFEEIDNRQAILPVCDVFELEWNGQVDAAIAMADRQNLTEISRFIKQRNFRWQELIQPDLQPPKSEAIKTPQHLRDAVTQALFLSWSGQEDLASKWREAIQNCSSDQIPPHLLGSSLLTIGSLAKGIESWSIVSSRTAFDCYRLTGNVDKMFEMAGLTELEGPVFDAWLETKQKQIRAGAADPTSSPQTMVDAGVLADLSHILYRLGYHEPSQKLEALLEKLPAGLDPNDPFNEEDFGSGELLSVWVDNSRRDRAITFLAKWIEEKYREKNFMKNSLPQLESLMTVVFPDFQGVATRLLMVLHQRQPNTWLTALQELETLYHGNLPPNWKRSHFDSFAWEVHDPRIEDDLSATQVSHVLAQVSRDLGFPMLAIQLLRNSPQYATTIEAIAETRAEMGDFDQAIRLIGSLDRDQTSDLTLQMRKVEWLEKLGRQEEANTSRRRALCPPLPAESYTYICDSLAKAGFKKEAADLLTMAWKSVEPEAMLLGSIAFNLSNLVEKDDPQLAANLLRLAQVDYFSRGEGNSLRPAFRIAQLAREYELWAKHYAKIGNLHEADRWVEKSFQLVPENIDVPMAVVRFAEEAKDQAMADRWFDLFYQFHHQHLTRWPQDTVFLNNLAWMCAKLDRHLDEAHQLARKACEIHPNDPTYLDTLAEVEFRLGNPQQAAQYSAQCLRLNSKNAHHREQYQRFSQAARSSNP